MFAKKRSNSDSKALHQNDQSFDSPKQKITKIAKTKDKYFENNFKKEDLDEKNTD